ncbi:mitochondrial carrier domain-containing protein [Pyronema domesticum]|nr:mitochondrial carrier domain-containing protein [Pyronema domesticum]
MARHSSLELEDLREAPRAEPVIKPTQRMLAACSGSLLTSLLVTPLDVVRVRLQTQAAEGASSAASEVLSQTRSTFKVAELGVSACCRNATFWINNLSGVHSNTACIATPHLESCLIEQTAQRKFGGTFEGLVKIARYEGVKSLWRGLSPTLALSIPSNVIYMTGYDWFRESPLSPFSGLNTVASPLVSGAVARVFSASFVSPIELFKTRLQSTSSADSGNFRATFHGVKTMVANEGIRTLWRGLGLTLWRDVPFSGLYWYGYEEIRTWLKIRRESAWTLLHEHPTGILPPETRQPKEKSHQRNIFYDSFLSGAISGAAAAFVTTPFDVGKTRRQIEGARPGASAYRNMSMLGTMVEIYKEGGIKGLWTGSVPRMLRVAPACAIMVSLLRSSLVMGGYYG